MPKAAKSSASSGTRKKHARKATSPESPQPSQFKAKPSKKEIKKGLAPPPKKLYVAPSKLKPAPIEVDPLDSYGLAAILPADLVVVLRRLAKKDSVTKTRALEELIVWVNEAKNDDGEAGADNKNHQPSVNTLELLLPVWLHRYPALMVHPSRRIRHLSVSLHALLFSVPGVRRAILIFLRENGSETEVSHMLGAWCMSAWDIDRLVSTLGGTSWREVIDSRATGRESTQASDDERFVLDESSLAQLLLPLIVTTIMDPESTYAAMNPSFSAASADSSASVAAPSRQGSAPHIVASSSSGGRHAPNAESSAAMLPRGDDDIESLEDRNARLRVGAIGALKWVFDTYLPSAPLVSALLGLLSSPPFWTILHHAFQPPFLKAPYEHPDVEKSDVSSGFGTGQTIVRRAGWDIVHVMLGESGKGAASLSWLDNLSEETFRLISSAVLRSAFMEPDAVVRSKLLGPLLIFLTKFRNAWVASHQFELASEIHQDADDGASELSATGNDPPSHSLTEESTGRAIPSHTRSAAYKEFLAFLSTGCNGSPIQGYPAILVILSTIPNEILPASLPALSEFFDGFWAAVEGDVFSTLAAERTKGTSAFLDSWGECLLWITGKLIKGPAISSDHTVATQDHGLDCANSQDNPDSPLSIARTLVERETKRLMGHLGQTLRADANVTGGKVAAILRKLESTAPELSKLAWNIISRFAEESITSLEDVARGDYALAFLAVLHELLPSEESSKREVESLVVQIALRIISACVDQKQSPDVKKSLHDISMNTQVLEKFMTRFGSVLDHNEAFVKHIDEFLRENIRSLLSLPSFVLSYLTNRSDITRATTAWHLLLSSVGSSGDSDQTVRLHFLEFFLDSSALDGPPIWAKPRGDELEHLATDVLNEALHGDKSMLKLTEKLLKRSDAFLHARVTHYMISTIITAVSTHANHLIRDSTVSLDVLRQSLGLLLSIERETAAIVPPLVVTSEVMPIIFVLAFVLPQCSPLEREMSVLESSKAVWETWQEVADAETCKVISEQVKRLLKSLLMSVDIRPGPLSLLHAFSRMDIPVDHVAQSEILPSLSELDGMWSSISAVPIDSVVLSTEPLVPLSSSTGASMSVFSKQSFDNSGFSSYARGVCSLLHVMVSDRKFARENVWALRHALALVLFASEALENPGVKSPVFQLGPGEKVDDLKDILRQTQQIAALLIIPEEDTWHKDVVAALAGKTLPPKALDPIGVLVKSTFEASLAHGTVRDSLVLFTALQYVLRSATKDSGDLWLELAGNLGDRGLQTSLAIFLAVSQFAPDLPRLDKYRNGFASRLMDVSPAKANRTGLSLLRRLNAIAPSAESDIIFIPQQRAVYLVQSLQKWMASDEDLSEDVESEIIQLLYHLIPILQTVQGAHWDFVMDLLEINLENSSLNDAGSLIILSRSLRSLSSIQDLSVSNKNLKAVWGERLKAVFLKIRDFLATQGDGTVSPKLRTVCREQALLVVQDLPSSMMDEKSLSAMSHLVTDSSVDVQKMAHRLLQQTAFKRTEHLNVEAGVSPDATMVQLPTELLALLQQNIDIFDGTGKSCDPDPFSHLLSWMILFDLFIDASVKVKTGYIDQMQNLDIIGNYFLPNVFEALGLEGGGRKPFKLDVWSVDEYWTTLYEPDVPQSLRLLAAHLYYRALLTVPSLIRKWLEELKDRQLQTAVNSFTSTYFSSVLIASELTLVKGSLSTPVTGEEPLNDDSFNVKVAFTAHEVVATFNVDDQQIEIGIKLPTEYPLKPVDVRDIRRVGVPEKLWRKWLFSLQQVVTSQNGHLVDALTLFKKNIRLHFEGQVECAICYSIISVTDRSLPTKPCKTCKNRFHSSCLYKWFNTSHSSSCPLCRSDIM